MKTLVQFFLADGYANKKTLVPFFLADGYANLSSQQLSSELTIRSDLEPKETIAAEEPALKRIPLIT